MLIFIEVCAPSRMSSTRPPASSTRRVASSMEAMSRMARSDALSFAMPGSSGSALASVARSADTRRGVGSRSANGRMTDSAPSKVGKLAKNPRHSCSGSSFTVTRAMMPAVP